MQKYFHYFHFLSFLFCNFASAQWAKVLTHNDFPEYKIKLKEPRLCDKTVQQVYDLLIL